MAISTESLLGLIFKSPVTRALTLTGGILLSAGGLWAKAKSSQEDIEKLKAAQVEDWKHHADDRVHFQHIDDNLEYIHKGQDELKEMVKELGRR